ncbi:universal stress protein [Thiohalophilus thiocyanatoxydans]|uniref:Universal stress protein n=1 Tax=Thiohalophilus thiocyanatoxydans TaxID=381308 RepID=A0A4R8IIF4_9GAMM|nr:universal stress protein [Thiohalophilus thiocyanatoxydans]TDY00446.1 universal stress protein A [Thiohalophilus thiocyanatoxydans]
MDAYKQILLAVDLSVEAEQIIERARMFARQGETRVTLMHVVEPLVTESSYDLVTSLPADLETTRQAQAEDFLQRKLDDSGLGLTSLRVTAGSIKAEILRVAEEIGADLIMLGTHGRHGVGLLLGSTANSVLHGTPCDVLAVRIKPVES